MSAFELRRKKRKTLSITVKQGKVIVSAPLKTPIEEIEKFLSEKTVWIQRKLSEYERKRESFADVLDYNAILVNGRRFSVTMSDKVNKIAFGDGEILIPVKYSSKAQRVRAIGVFYKKFAFLELKRRLDGLSAVTGLSYKDFSLTNAKGKWGSCDGDNDIMLNWRLCMLDFDTADYVIVHELCHTKEHNHSASFWALVERFYPNYKAARKKLKADSVVNELFR